MRRRRREYNFAVIPVVTSAYPNWDVADREADRAGSAEGAACSTAATSRSSRARRRGADEIAAMPHDSPWPILLASPRRSSSRCS